jgi:hypothetical protein
MRVSRTVLKNPFCRSDEQRVVFVAECETCGYAAVAMSEQAAIDVVANHQCTADRDKEDEGAA